MKPQARLPKELDLPRAFELTRKLVIAGAEPEVERPLAAAPVEESAYQTVRRLAMAESIATAPTATLPAIAAKRGEVRPQGGALRYWLWRLAGRPAAEPAEQEEFRRRDHDHAIKRERKKVAELARLTQTLQRAHETEADRLRAAAAKAEGEAAALHLRVAELEKAAHESRRSGELEMARLHNGQAAALAAARAEAAKERDELVVPLRWDLDQARARIATLEAELAQSGEAQKARADGPSREDLAEAQARAAAAEERARLAENKVEILKDALDIAKSCSNGPASTDLRFRDAKRCFARAFHPDQGGRNDAEKQRMFLQFWPELERIEREG